MIDSKKIVAKMSSLLHRFHVILFVVIILGGLAVLMLFLYTAFESASDTEKSPIISTGSFDEETIKRLEELNTDSEETRDLELPSGRINPFVE